MGVVIESVNLGNPSESQILKQALAPFGSSLVMDGTNQTAVWISIEEHHFFTSANVSHISSGKDLHF